MPDLLDLLFPLLLDAPPPAFFFEEVAVGCRLALGLTYWREGMFGGVKVRLVLNITSINDGLK